MSDTSNMDRADALRLLRSQRDNNRNDGWMSAKNLPSITADLARNRYVEARTVGFERQYRITFKGVVALDALEQAAAKTAKASTPSPKDDPRPLKPASPKKAPKTTKRKNSPQPIAEERYTFECRDSEGVWAIPVGACFDADPIFVHEQMLTAAQNNPGIAFRLIDHKGKVCSLPFAYMLSPEKRLEQAIDTLLQTVEATGKTFEWIDAVRADRAVLCGQRNEAV